MTGKGGVGHGGWGMDKVNPKIHTQIHPLIIWGAVGWVYVRRRISTEPPGRRGGGVGGSCFCVVNHHSDKRRGLDFGVGLVGVFYFF